jgi:primosomal protein N' (replication factor Y)
MAIARVALPVATHSPFDYWVPAGLAVERGSVVRVRLARRALIGVVVDIATTTEVEEGQLQPIQEVVTAFPPLPADLLELSEFVAGYYQEPQGLVLAQMVPPLGRGDAGHAREAAPALGAQRLAEEGRAELDASLSRAPRARELVERWRASADGVLEAADIARLPPHLRGWIHRWRESGWSADASTSPSPHLRTPDAATALNAEQRHAVAAIGDAHGRYAPFLLDGITGSGKTAVYLAAAARCIAAGGQALLLVPEINLTPQFLQRIAHALPGMRAVTLHSRLPAGLRRRHWAAAAAGEPDLVLGTRLAVFAPMPRLGLVVVDEEHDASFKQQDGVRYQGRDVAIWRARQRGVPIVLGTATPSLETIHQTERGRYSRLVLGSRALAPAGLPAVVFAPHRDPAAIEGIGVRLRAAIAERLKKGEQSLVFINRRGYAPSLLCGSCGWQASCAHCSARLVIHRDAGLARCHHCGHAERLPASCPECGNVDLVPRGFGTQRLERALIELFPPARIVRIDRDSTQRRSAFADARDRMDAGLVDILVGTQMLAKGHDFPRLTLVGVLGADNALYSADFRATERLAALLFQVAGRAGRAALAGEVIVQTDFPEHPLYRSLAAHNYGDFAASLLSERRAAALPPFAHLALVTAEAADRDVVDAFLDGVRAAGLAQGPSSGGDVAVFPPVPAALARRAGMERGQVLAQSENRAALQRFLPNWRSAIEALPSSRVRWALDVDPAGFA